MGNQRQWINNFLPQDCWSNTTVQSSDSTELQGIFTDLEGISAKLTKMPGIEATLFLDKRARYPYFSVCQLDDLEAQLSKRILPVVK